MPEREYFFQANKHLLCINVLKIQPLYDTCTCTCVCMLSYGFPQGSM